MAATQAPDPGLTGRLRLALERITETIRCRILLAVTLSFLPLRLYLDDASVIGSSLATTWNGRAWRAPLLIPPTLVGLWVLRRRGAEWFAIPVAWLATWFDFAAMALVGRPALAAALAVPVPLMTRIVAILWAGYTVRRPRRREVVQQLEPAR